jgi:CubicO group peptidase (beta-lactamase class C family)
MELARPEELGFSPARLARISSTMKQYVERRQFAGIVTLVARRGRVVHFETIGKMDIESGRPMRRDAIFRIYSMTKPVTSTAVMILLEEARFRLGDPISDYLPIFKRMQVLQPRPGGDFDLVPARREITIRDLLTHVGGLSYGYETSSYIDELHRKKIWSRVESAEGMTVEDVISEIARMPLAFHPGKTYRYSFSTDVLGYLVQVLSGKPLEVFLKERILEPLGMSDTAFWVPPEKVGRFAACYGPAEEGGLKLIGTPLNHNFTLPAHFASGGGGLVSTAEDYLRFSQMLLNKGRMGSARILGRKTVELMFLNHLAPDIVYPDPGYGFGLGGRVLLDPARAQVLGSEGSWGWGGAANTKFWIDPREDLIGILMTQFMPSDLYPLYVDFINLTYQALVD